MGYLDIYGREEEFKLDARIKNKNYSDLFFPGQLIVQIENTIDKDFNNSRFRIGERGNRVFTGGSVYIDEESPEICTPPCLEKKGFVEDIVNATIAQRLLLFEGFKRLNKAYSGDVSFELSGYSSHENISFNKRKIHSNIEQVIPDNFKEGPSENYANIIYSSIYRTIGPMLLLFFKNYESSYGIACNNKTDGGNRLHFRGEYNPDIDQLRAGIAFLYGSVRGIEKKIIENFDPDNPKKIESLFYKIFPFSFESLNPSYYYELEDYNTISVGNLEMERPFIYFYNTSDEERTRIDFTSYCYKNEPRNIRYNGSETKLTIFEKGREKEINLTDALKEYVDFFKDEIKYVSDDKTWDVLQEFAEGKRKFQMDEKKLPDYYVLNLGNIGEYERKLIGNDDPYIYLKNFKPQKEFEFMGNIVKNGGDKNFLDKNNIAEMKLTNIGWDMIYIHFEYGKAENRNRRMNSFEVSIDRNYFMFFDYFLNKDNVTIKKKMEMLQFVNFFNEYMGKEKTGEKLKEYIEYKENKHNERIRLDSMRKFEDSTIHYKVKIPSLEHLNLLYDKLLK